MMKSFIKATALMMSLAVAAGMAPAGNTAVAQSVAKDTVPPPTWKEYWFEHNQLMRRVFYNTAVAVYYDPETPDSITWPNELFTKVWNYTTHTYGAFGWPDEWEAQFKQAQKDFPEVKYQAITGR